MPDPRLLDDDRRKQITAVFLNCTQTESTEKALSYVLDQVEKEFKAAKSALGMELVVAKSEFAAAKSELEKELAVAKSELEKELVVAKSELENEKARTADYKRISEHRYESFNRALEYAILLQETTSRAEQTIKGSTTRAKVWQDISKNNQVTEKAPFINIHPIVEGHSASLKQLEKRKFPNEAAMYKPLVDHLQPLFTACNAFANDLGPLTVSNTHKIRYLHDMQPDISICRSNNSTPSPLTLAAFVEVKDKPPLGDAQYGQAVDYLLLMCRYQPSRRYHVGMVTTISTSSILVLDYVPGHRQDYVPRVHRMSNLGFPEAISHLLTLIEKRDHNPPKPPFSIAVNEMKTLLGRPRRSALGAFPAPADRANAGRGNLMAVKTSLGPRSGYINEVEILKTFMANAPPFLPLLVHNVPGHVEFGVMPVGKPFRMHRLYTQEDMRSCLNDILSALSWIHKLGIVHRDVRLDNVVLFKESNQIAETEELQKFTGNMRAVLIDFDRATRIEKDTIFEGGYVCCPPRLLEQLARASHPRGFDEVLYRPQKSDDLLSFVLFLVALVLPHRFETFDYCKVERPESNEFNRLLKLWQSLEASSVWSTAVKAAQQENYDALKDFLDLFVVL